MEASADGPTHDTVSPWDSQETVSMEASADGVELYKCHMFSLASWLILSGILLGFRARHIGRKHRGRTLHKLGFSFCTNQEENAAIPC